jgi:hypothetical protein
MKLRHGVTKYLLRQALRGIVPDAILERRDKKGLVVPFQQWLNGPLRGWADELECSLAQRLTPPPPAGERGEFDRGRYHRASLELWFRSFFPRGLDTPPAAEPR